MTATSDLSDRVSTLMPRLRHELVQLTRIPSINFDGYPIDKVHEAGDYVLELFRSAGIDSARLLEIPESVPAVYADQPGPPDAPTVLLYAHYDIQPPGDSSLWQSPPFEPEERAGRLYGRGAADDKSGVIGHLGAIRALGGSLPVRLKIVIEGEEETGRGTLESFVASNPELFQADIISVGDGGNWQLGVPTLTTTLRGMAVVDVEVQTLEEAVHSGMYGGAGPDALVALIQILATLHDAAGNVAVEGLEAGTYNGPHIPDELYRKTARVLEGVDHIGEGSIGDRLFTKPSITVIGIDAPAVDGAANILIPRVRARISARLAPSQRPEDAQQAIVRHVERVVPWNVKVTCTPGGTGRGFSALTEGPGYAAAREALREAYGRDAVEFGQGGSIPLVAALQQVNTHAEIIMWGAQEPESTIHAPNESVDLGELERFVLTEARFLEGLGPISG